MTYEFEYLMKTLACAAVGKRIEAPVRQVDWDSLFEYALKQSVLPMFAYAATKLESDKIPPDVSKRMSATALTLAVQEFSRQLSVLSLLSELDQHGIKAVIIKGFSLNGCYAVPELRISGDVDIYIGKKKEKRALKLFKAKGISIKKRAKGDHHSICWTKKTGMIEIHSLLYNEYIQDIWFSKISEKELLTEPFELIETDNGRYYTLGKTDHMIFLALHLIKHFIISGICLRNMLDVTLFYTKNYTDLNLERFWSIIRRLDFEVLINTVIGAAIHYCGLPAEWYDYLTMKPSQENMETVLTDMETLNYLDSDDIKNRETGWYAYSREKSAQTHGKLWYRLYMTRMVARQALFPTRKDMMQRYPIIEKYPILIPFAWLHRLLFKGIVRLIRHNVAPAIIEETIPIHVAGQKRMEMFRKLNMIKKI